MLLCSVGTGIWITRGAVLAVGRSDPLIVSPGEKLEVTVTGPASAAGWKRRSRPAKIPMTRTRVRAMDTTRAERWDIDLSLEILGQTMILTRTDAEGFALTSAHRLRLGR